MGPIKAETGESGTWEPVVELQQSPQVLFHDQVSPLMGEGIPGRREAEPVRASFLFCRLCFCCWLSELGVLMPWPAHHSIPATLGLPFIRHNINLTRQCSAAIARKDDKLVICPACWRVG